MSVYQRIMVAVDGSDTAERGLKEAIALANDQKARLAIVYVIDLVIIFEFGEPSITYADSAREFARGAIERARRTAQRTPTARALARLLLPPAHPR